MTYTEAQIEAAAKAAWEAIPEHGPWAMADAQDWADARVQIRAALAAAEEAGEWEYAWATGPNHTYNWASREEAEEFIGNPVPIRRRPAGPWLPVEGSEG